MTLFPLSRLPAPLRGLLAAVLALALSAVLTFGLHNQDTYLTGFWDDYSQALVFARMLQMQQDQQSPGGFLGTYTEEFGDTQNRYLYRENTPVEPEDYHAYTHQTGLQGWALGILNKVFSIWQDSGEARERMLYATNSILFYAAALALAWAAGRAFGAPAGVGWALAAVLAPWVQRGMKDLYWCLWTWLLPMLAGVLLCALTRRRGRTPWYCYALCFAAPMLRCMCGFEFISTFLILGEIPLFACWAAALAEGKGAAAWFRRMFFAGVAAVAGVAAAFGVWLVQGYLYFGSWGESFANALAPALFHTGGEEISAFAVAWRYLSSAEPVLQLGPVSLAPGALLGIGAAALAAAFGVCIARHRRPPARLWAVASVWVLSALAPLSWMLLAKVHCDIHTHLVPMLWNFALAPATCLVVAALAGWGIRYVWGKVKRVKP